MKRSDLHELRRLDKFKRAVPIETMTPLGSEMVGYFDQAVRPRQTKLGIIARHWEELVPQSLSEHCALFSLKAGALTVLVDGSVHLYELKQLLLAGLQSQLLLTCRSAGVRKIILKPGIPPDPAAPKSSRA